MERVQVSWAVILAIFALSACAGPHPPFAPSFPAAAETADVASPAWEAPRGVVELLRYSERIRWLTPAVLQREYTQSEQAFADAPDNSDARLRLALLLSLPRAAFRDDKRARELLRAETTVQPDNGYAAFANAVLTGLNERRALEGELDEERRQRQALRAKLDQLKAIEEDMDRRMQPTIITPR